MMLGPLASGAVIALTLALAAPAAATFPGRNGALVFDIGRSTALDQMSEECATPNCEDGRLFEFDLRRRRLSALRTCSAAECHDGSPAVGPRGRSLAFTRVDYGDPESEEAPISRHYIGISRRDGSSVRLIELSVVDPTFSPGGRRLVYTQNVNSVSNLRVLDRSSGQSRRLTRSETYSPDWSTRNRIAFVRRPPARRFTASRDIFTIRPDGRALKRLTHTGRTDSPSWAPDGRKLAFQDDRPRTGIYTMRADGSRRRLLRRGEVDDLVWSPDGKRIAFTKRQRLWVMRSDGSRARMVFDASKTGYQANVGRLSWPPARG